jgi:DNA processing protein
VTTCPDCLRRSALIAALAPAISRLSFSSDELLGILALPEARLLDVAKVKDRGKLSHHLEKKLAISPLTKQVPTALCRHDPGYPEALAQLDSAPAVLYATCRVERLRELFTQPTVAIIGGREHTRYAQDITSGLARELAQAGVIVISGIDRGLEGIAQYDALHAGGPTIAVMPGAPEIPYSRQNKDLHQYILARAVAISEFPPGYLPLQRWSFIASRRIIAALASIVVIVEARGKISALLIAHVAAGLGHDVAVVPGRVTDPGGFRTFGLLRDGAHPVSCARDVLELISTCLASTHTASCSGPSPSSQDSI